MATTEIQEIRDFHDVIRLLQEHPEWRVELRRIVLTDDLLALPSQMAKLTEQVATLVAAQNRTEAELVRLAEAQRHTDTQLATLAKMVQVLTEDIGTLKTEVHRVGEKVGVLETDVGVLKTDVSVLKTDVGVLKTDMGVLKTDVGVLKTDMGDLKGKGLETHYRQNGSPFFGVLLRQAHVLSTSEVQTLLDAAVDQGTLSLSESLAVRRADLLVEGKRRSDGVLVHLVVEVSWTVDTRDVERAAQRASLLGKTGKIAMPVVAGDRIGERAAELAKKLKVWQMTDDEVIEPAA